MLHETDAADEMLLTALYVVDAYDAASPARIETLASRHGIGKAGVFAVNAVAGASLETQARALAEAAKRQDCPNLVIDEGLDLSPELCARLKRQGLSLYAGRVLAAMPREPRELAALAVYDACIATTAAARAALRDFGIIPLYQPTPPDGTLAARPDAPDDAARPLDILFLGDVWDGTGSTDRLAALTFLRAQGLDVRCLGAGFAFCRAFPGPGEGPPSPRDLADAREYPVDWLRQARIGLVLSAGQDLRCLHVALAGALLVCPETAGRYFRPGTEAVTFRSLGELAAVCRHFLEHEALRQEIAARGAEKAKRYYRRDRLLRRLRLQVQADTCLVASRQGAFRPYRADIVGAMLDDARSPETRAALLASVTRELGVEATRQAVAGALAGLPSEVVPQAVGALEHLLLRFVTAGEYALADVLAPVCLDAATGRSRTLTLTCAIHAGRALRRDTASLETQLDMLLATLDALVAIAGSTGDAFFDDLYLKRRLRACAGGKRGVLLFGAGGNGQAWADWIRRHLPGVALAFIDNDARKHHTRQNGLDILPPGAIAARGFDLLVVASSYAEPIAAQLVSLGYVLDEQFVLTRGLDPGRHELALPGRTARD